MAINRELNMLDNEASSLEGIGGHHLSTGDAAQGVVYLNEALEIYRRLGMRRDIERVRARLASVG
ncbi:hypothetical protein GCM10009838_56410 [Catenulispora subtropica]|uniref:Tetratricopeptide repeat protein n=1 Tax=Catenulispora subtropica TaxID=450798 RepID=A0ABN2SH13_9ACTN